MNPPYPIRFSLFLALLCLALFPPAARAGKSPAVTFESLLAEMADPAAVARLPKPEYRSLQASSYNRESVHRDKPGWFADSDGLGFIRETDVAGRHEWVVMEHAGPGCLTRIWTPYFYYDLANHTGPNVRIYLDGSETPVLDESLIELVTARGSIKNPFATYTARAGDLYLPIPFGRSCRVTLSQKPFYHILNYRAYAQGTEVQTFTRDSISRATSQMDRTGRILTAKPSATPGNLAEYSTRNLPAGHSLRLNLQRGPRSVTQFTVTVPDIIKRPSALRSTVLVFSFDGENTVWCPLGDFFGSADSLHPFHTFQRTVTAAGEFIGRWPMPYRKSATLEVLNLDKTPIEVRLEARLDPWEWNNRSLHFHANWRPDEVVPGTPFRDWNFIDINGRGIYVGDAWTVLNPQKNTWWGEGDEKIYVDDAWDAGFPTHFGTGTEDYYGWAGGVLPTRDDEFSTPFLANIRVGGVDGHTEGYNICTRTRGLDAIPFQSRLRFDMESSFGTDIRNPWNLLDYSAVTFWYGTPGARQNRPPQSDAASAPIPTLETLRRQSESIRQRVGIKP